ncbi:MAG: hypothetical protein ACKV2T_03540 [Kofleriaceae bacterium]
MSKLHGFLALVITASAGLAQADALTKNDLYVVKPEGTAETAVHKPGRIPWCDGAFKGEVWDARRVLRSINGSADWSPDNGWERGLEHMCQFADDPLWQRQATYVVQAAMNSDPDKTQDEVVARIGRLISASQKARANAGKEPTDEDRFAFAEMHLTPIAPERGVDTAKIGGPVPWCDGVKVAEKWDAGRIARNAEGRDGISRDGVIESALHLCQRPNDPTWKQKAGHLLQGWMNWTKQSQTDAIASITVRIQLDKVTAHRESLCKALVPSGELAGAGNAYALAKRKFFGCYDNRHGETWQGNLHFVGDETGHYVDGSDIVESEVARLYWLFASTSTPRNDLPANSAYDNKQLLAYAAVAADMANLDEKAITEELSRAPFANNDLARVIANESLAVLRWRKKLYDAAIDKLAASDADYASILRDAAKQSSATWTKLTAPWKAELDMAFAFEKKLASSPRSAVAGCSKDFAGVVEKLLASYKTTDYLALMTKIQDDPIASILLSRIALCHGIDKLANAGVLKDLSTKSRKIRGRRSYTYFAIVDKLAEVKANRPRLLLEVENFGNPMGNGGASGENSDIDLEGSVPLDPNAVESRGVVGKVTKTGTGIRVEFKKVSRMEAQIECKETNRLSHIDGNGNLIWRRNCWHTGKMVKVDLTPQPQDVPAVFSTGIKPGVFAAIDYDGNVAYVKANADAKSITTFLGYAL